MPGFYSPWWLAGLIGIPVLWWLYIRAEKTKMHESLRFSRVNTVREAMGERKGAGQRLQRLLVLLTLLAISLLLIGLADPHIPLEQTKEGANVVFALDVSGSMAATDYPPSRLESAKSATIALIRELDPKDNAGVVIFEAGATTAAYLTPDKDRVIDRLQGIRVRSGQTTLGDGLALAVDMASSMPGRKNFVILLSDGISNAGMVSPAEAAAYARANNVQVFVVGIGSSNPSLAGIGPSGDPEFASIDESTLRTIAGTTMGKYFRSIDDTTLREIYESLNTEIIRDKEETSIRDVFIVAGILTLLAGMYMRYGRRRIIP